MPSRCDDDISAVNNVTHELWQYEDTVTPRSPSNLSTPSHSRNVSGFQRDVLTPTMQNPNQSVYEMFGGSMDVSPISSVNKSSHFDNASYENIMGNETPSSLRRRSSPSSLSRKVTTSRIGVADIVFAFLYGKFDDQEIRSIKVALQTAIRSVERKNFVIRKKLPISKSIRRMNGNNSRNKTSPGFVGQDINHWDDTMQNIDIYNIKADPLVKDCTDHIKQNTAKNKLTTSSSIINSRDKVQSNEKYTDTEDIIACVPNSQNWRIEKANDKPIEMNITNACRKTNPFKCNFKIHSPIVEEDSIACVPNSQNWRIEKANDKPIKMDITNACRKTNPFKCNFKIHSPIVEEDSIACVPNSQNWRIEKANDKPIKMDITNAFRKTNPFKCNFNILSPIVEEDI